MAANAALAGIKIAAGVWGHSQALIADGVESMADILSSLIVWRALVVAEAPADEDHPYGHGKAEPIASAIVAGVLLFAAAAIAVQSIREIATPHEVPEAFTLVILLLVVAVKETLFRWVRRQGDALDSSAVRGDAWHHRSDAITSFAAALGITIALLGGPAYAAADDYAALAAAVIIAWNGWRLLRPALAELMDTAPNAGVAGEIRRVAAKIPNVRAVEKCIVRKMGYHYFVDMHVEVDAQMTVERGHEIAHQVKDRILARLPKVRDVLVHIEPVKGSRAGPEASNLSSPAEGI